MNRNTLGSEIFGTHIVRADEALLLVQTATENGATLETAYDDMKMIDDLFLVQRYFFATLGETNRTATGRIRKNSNLSYALDSVINARITADQEDKQYIELPILQ